MSTPSKLKYTRRQREVIKLLRAGRYRLIRRRPDWFELMPTGKRVTDWAQGVQATTVQPLIDAGEIEVTE